MDARARPRLSHVRCLLRDGVFACMLLAIPIVMPMAAPAAADDPHSARRAAMVREVAHNATATASQAASARVSRQALAALRKVPRHEFVPDQARRHAYENRPLAIGYGQTISQPYIVALMTTLAQPEDGKVLEIGTGSGYQAAVLAELADRVYSVEIIEPLGRRAARTLQRLGYGNVETTIADGYYGWKAHAPFDAIVVTAAANAVPPPLIEQLKPGGRMVIPVGTSFFTQTLLLVRKDEDGRVRTRQILPVQFVPLTRGIRD